MDLITSVHNSHIKKIKKLLNRNNFFCCDQDVINLASEQGNLLECYSVNNIKLCDKNYLVSQEVMDHINKKKTNLCGIVSFPISEKVMTNKIIYLDGISDPVNLAKIVLLMFKNGYTELMLGPNCVHLNNYKCIALIENIILKIKVIYADVNMLKSLKNDGYKIISTALKNAVPLNTLKAPEKFILVFGNEATGISSEVLEASDCIIKIPIKNLDSLNVAVSCAIILSAIQE